jgi:uncharacterized phage protein (TIGR01671 family)
MNKQREIKFRIWSNTMKRWLCEDSQYLQMDGKKVHAAPWSTMEWEIPSEEYIIQQFTGEFDKHKKEIFEGDIVKVTSEEWGNENFVAEVIFSEASFLLKIDDNDIRGLWSGGDIEVIGNIFEQ